jgi:nucleoid DNA-binding protein
MNTNKKIIADKLSADSKLSQQDAIRFINSFISLIKNNTQSKKVKIAGFGSFFKKNTIRRVGRNPKTGESYIIEPTKRLSFRASSILKDFLNP